MYVGERRDSVRIEEGERGKQNGSGAGGETRYLSGIMSPRCSPNGNTPSQPAGHKILFLWTQERSVSSCLCLPVVMLPDHSSFYLFIFFFRHRFHRFPKLPSGHSSFLHIFLASASSFLHPRAVHFSMSSVQLSDISQNDRHFAATRK